MNRTRLSLLIALAAVCLIGAPSGHAFADPCTDLGGTVVSGECRISTNVGNKSGEFNLTQPLHILSGGRITVPALAGGNSLTINACAAPASCSFVMDPGAVITGNVTTAGGVGAGITINATGPMTIGGTGATGAVISSNQSGGSCSGSGRGGAIALTAGGDIVTQAGSVISANGTPCPGGSITMISSQGTVTHAGVVESVSTLSGTGATQRPGGGPITIIARCDLNIDGTVRSKGSDAGADLIHLEGGCNVVIDGLVESTAIGHGIPNSPPNHCGPLASPPRLDKPANSNACVEVWAGDSLVISATGQVNADLGQLGSNEGISWIDLFARGNISINGDAVLPFAVHANGLGGSGADGEEGGIVTVKSTVGSVTASGLALQATSTAASNADGGTVIVEAAQAVTFTGNTPTVVVKGNDIGGTIGMRAYNSAFTWTDGNGDARPIATGSIALTGCAGVTTTGTNFNGETPTINPGLCGGAPAVPSYVVLPACLCGGPFPPGVECPQDRFRVLTRTVSAVPFSVPNTLTIQEAVDQAASGEVIGVFLNTDENVSIDSKALTITQCTVARVTALDNTQPTFAISSPDRILVIGLDTVGGTSGWLLSTDGHELRGVRARGASEFGIEVAGDSNKVSWNRVDQNAVGVGVSGSSNALRGGTVENNSGDGIQFTDTATGNTIQGATVQQNGGNGITVAGAGNTVRDNSRVELNGGHGIAVSGAGNTIKGNTAGSASKGNGGDGVNVTAGGNLLESNKTSANLGAGFTIRGGGAGDPNVLKGNQGNAGGSGSKTENTGGEYVLQNSVRSTGSNKADNISVPSASKCPQFPANNQTVSFAAAYVCE